MENSTNGNDDTLLSVGAGGDLTLKDIILEYSVAATTDKDDDESATLINVAAAGAHLTFQNGVSITQVGESTSWGGNVESGGEITMNKGTISGIKGARGGVRVGSNGSFTMYGGRIAGNDGNIGGVSSGLDDADGFTFSKAGGVIYGSDAAEIALRNGTGTNPNSAAYIGSQDANLDRTLGPEDDVDSTTPTNWDKWTEEE
jgi:hypothetical protein